MHTSLLVDLRTLYNMQYAICHSMRQYDILRVVPLYHTVLYRWIPFFGRISRAHLMHTCICDTGTVVCVIGNLSSWMKIHVV